MEAEVQHNSKYLANSPMKKCHDEYDNYKKLSGQRSFTHFKITLKMQKIQLCCNMEKLTHTSLFSILHLYFSIKRYCNDLAPFLSSR